MAEEADSPEPDPAAVGSRLLVSNHEEHEGHEE